MNLLNKTQVEKKIFGSDSDFLLLTVTVVVVEDEEEEGGKYLEETNLPLVFLLPLTIGALCALFF